MNRDAGSACYHNSSIECEERKCAECGWNPSVSEKRLDAFLMKLGIKKKDTSKRVINATDIKLRIQRNCIPLAEKGYSAFSILAETMRCIDSAESLNAEEAICYKECVHRERGK